MLFSFFVLSVCVFSVLGQNADYKGYKVYNVKFENEEQQAQLDLLKNDEVDFWRKPSVQLGVVGQAMVPPSKAEWFEESLEKLGVEKDVAIEDVYDFLSERTGKNIDKRSTNNEETFDYNSYHRYNVILNHLRRLQETHATSTTISFEVVESGKTEEERPLVYVKLTSKTATTTPRPVVVIEAAIIPREWVTIPSALYVIDKLLSTDGATLLDQFEWIVVPVLNPDGYEYTHTNLRLWMKNKSTRSDLGFICPGVNINRNFDLDWSVSDSSTTPCSHLFAGVGAFSEEESKFMQSIIEEYGARIRLYLSLQNSGGFISYPWLYEKAASGMFRPHLLLSLDMVAAMKGEYTAGIGSIVYGGRASGSSTDFAREKSIMYTFNIDIVPVGNSGVMVPESEIVNVAEDVWRAVSVAANGVSRPR